MMFMIKIAGIRIQIHSEIPLKRNKKINHFSFKTPCQADLKVSFLSCPDILIPDDTLLLDEKIQWGRNNGTENEVSVFINNEEAKKAVYCLQVNKLWNNAVITYQNNYKDILSLFLGTLGEILFRNCILFHQGMVIHAAAIEWNGKGIMFSAPSGTGKTTQANLWRRYKGAKIINADRPAVRVIDGTPWVYGTLWNGSSARYKNRSVPLSAIILLEQANKNEVRRLDGKEAVSRLMPRCFLPYYQEDIMKLAFDDLEGIIAVTPVYLLSCRPDYEAVELVYQCLK